MDGLQEKVQHKSKSTKWHSSIQFSVN